MNKWHLKPYHIQLRGRSKTLIIMLLLDLKVSVYKFRIIYNPGSFWMLITRQILHSPDTGLFLDQPPPQRCHRVVHVLCFNVSYCTYSRYSYNGHSPTCSLSLLSLLSPLSLVIYHPPYNYVQYLTVIHVLVRGRARHTPSHLCKTVSLYSVNSNSLTLTP